MMGQLYATLRVSHIVVERGGILWERVVDSGASHNIIVVEERVYSGREG